MWNPIKALLTWANSEPVETWLKLQRPSQIGLTALNVARGELGRGEAFENNAGPDVRRYRGKLQSDGQAWCACFVSYCFEMAAVTLKRPMPFEHSGGARQLFKRAVKAGMKVPLSEVRPGDIVCWGRGPRGGWQGHVGIVSEVCADGRWFAICGNEGPFPSLVAEYDKTKSKRLIGFARV